MAVLQALLSGSWRVSSTSDVITKLFSAQITCSTFQQQEIVLLPNVSDFVVSLATLSAPNLILLTSTQLVRVNFAGYTSMVSAASAGIQFLDAYYIMGSGAGLPSAIHLSNSGSNSATVTVYIGQ